MDGRKNIDGACAALKAKREASGLDLKTVFQRTRLSVDILEAIENGDFHLLPVPVYTRNFIKIYTRALEMDSQPVLDSYESYLCSLKPVEPCLKEEIPPEKMGAKIGRHRNYLWTAVIAVVALIAVWFISLQYKPAEDSLPAVQENIATQQPKSIEPVEPPDLEPVINVVAPVASNDNPKDAAKKTAAEKSVAKPVVKEQTLPAAAVKKEPRAVAASVAASEEPAVLIIRATEETWLRIKTDREPEIQFLLQPGDKVERKAAQFEMDIGNAGGVKLQYKGKIIENLGVSGQVIHIRLPE